MTPLILLEELKLFVQQTIKDIILPTKIQKGDPGQEYRPAEVHLMNLPDRNSETKKAPYVLLQLINGADDQQEGEKAESTCNIRVVACVYNEDAEEGALSLLNVLMRLRTRLLQRRVVGNQFSLRLPLEYLVYPDNTAPYFLGEMMTTWELRTVEREVTNLWDEPQTTQRPTVTIKTN